MSFPPEKEAEPKAEEVAFSAEEVSVVTQGLTDAQAFVTQQGAPEEVVASVNAAYEVVYGKVEVSEEPPA